VILAASGMATGGRVLHHLIQYLGGHKNMIILTGFQAAGTRGATLAKGGTQLMQWLRAIPGTPKRVFTVHGELEAADTLRRRIETELGWNAMVPEHGSTWAI
jgi:metallo-beta-lactamase family protein